MIGEKTIKTIKEYEKVVELFKIRFEKIKSSLFVNKTTDEEFATFQMLLREWSNGEGNESIASKMSCLDEELKLYHKNLISRLDMLAELNEIGQDIIIALKSEIRRLNHRYDLAIVLKDILENEEELPEFIDPSGIQEYLSEI